MSGEANAHTWHPEVMDSLPAIRLCVACRQSLRVSSADYEQVVEWIEGEWRPIDSPCVGPPHVVRLDPEWFP